MTYRAYTETSNAHHVLTGPGLTKLQFDGNITTDPIGNQGGSPRETLPWVLLPEVPAELTFL